MHLLVQCGEKPDWVKLRQTVHDYCYSVMPSPSAGERANAKASTSHTVKAARVRKARRANRRRMQKSPRIMISSTVIAGVVDGDTSRNIVGATGRDTKSTMFLKMNR